MLRNVALMPESDGQTFTVIHVTHVGPFKIDCLLFHNEKFGHAFVLSTTPNYRQACRSGSTGEPEREQTSHRAETLTVPF